MADSNPLLRVAIADDQTLLRSTLSLLVNSQPDMTVVGEAVNGQEAFQLVSREHPDVLLLDIRMPGQNGLDALASIRKNPAFTSTKIIILTMYELDDYVRDALRLGADGYILKDNQPDQILDAIRRVHTLGTQLSPSITRSLISQFVHQAEPVHRLDQAGCAIPPPGANWQDSLTPREREVLNLIGQGLSNEEIMAALVISKGTIKSHIAALRRKTQARDRVHLALLAGQLPG